MANTLENLAKSVKNTARGIGKYLAVGAAIGSSYFAGNKVYADEFVLPSDNHTTINNIIASASNENILFCGIYQLPPSPGNNASYILDNPNNVGLIKDPSCQIETKLRGYDPLGDVILKIGPNSNNNTISGFIIENGYAGVVLNANFSPSAPIYITGNTIQNVDTAISWTNKDVVGDNMLPSVIVDTNYIKAVNRGNVFDEAGIAPNNQKAWAQVSNNTFEEIGAIVFEPPIIVTQTANAGTLYTLPGVNQFDGNVILNSNGITLPREAFQGGSFTVASNDIPDANGEFQIALNPPPGYVYVRSIREQWGGNNFVEDPMLRACHSPRPLPLSPLRGPQYLNSDGSVRGYGGAFFPAADINGDGRLTNADQTAMNQVIAKNGIGVTPTEIDIFDLNCDNLVNNQDLAMVIQGGEVENPIIPTISTWGAVNLGLLTLIGGTLILQRRNKLTSKI